MVETMFAQKQAAIKIKMAQLRFLMPTKVLLTQKLQPRVYIP